MTRLTPQLLLNAYSIGIFPMAESREDPDLYWVDPEERGVLPLDGFHISKRLARTVKSRRFDVRIDGDFEQALDGCAAATSDRPDTWISDQIKDLYLGLAASGHAHSVESWRDGRMVGGLYGVALGGAFFGESMFSRETDASKVALVYLVIGLRLGGFQLLDTQFVTRHLAQFGAREIPRAEYRRQLGLALRVPAIFQTELPQELVLAELDILRRPPYGELTSNAARFDESIG